MLARPLFALAVATLALGGPASAWDASKRGRYGGLDLDRLETGSLKAYDRIDIVGVLAASKTALANIGAATQDARAFLDDANTNGPYTDFDSKSNSREAFDNTEVIPQSGPGALRDLRYLRMRDRDATNYPANFRVISNVLRLTNAGLMSAGTFVPQRKDLHGVWATAIGNSVGVDRGMSGILGEAIQLGTGVATNEFSAMAPDYGAAQPALLAPVIGILYNYKANADATHKAWGLQANLYGFQSTAAFRAASVPALGQPGAAQVGLQMDELTVSGPAITMPQPLSGTAKGVVDYGGGTTSFFDTATNAFVFKVNGNEAGRIDGGGWLPWGPTLTCGTGALTSATGAGRFRQDNKTIHFSVKISVATNGTCGGFLNFSLPVAANAADGAQFAGSGYEDAVSGANLRVRGAGSTVRLTRYDNAYMGGDGAVLVVSGTYEAAP